ncbi:R-spondin-1-like [Myxocyprinus asiaticus]|uniref:R-spondin-1-like n=1 Tax=Myxocyprinus asiaticus TaxID=70543 RepID=UPI002223E574|nr:R-spondin-1-like [Myxocyprinus asiaticus]
MHLGLVALAVVFLSFLTMGHGDNLKVSKGRRQRRISTEVPPSCSNGCEICSEYNGCLKCRPRLFILLERNDIRQIGVCLAACPVGYYGIRNRDMNKCTQCKIENCEACFSRNFCTKCKEGLYSHRGRCYSSCPDGLSTVNDTMECVVQCDLSEWSSWGPCMKKNKTCGFKKGNQTRTREPVQLPSPAISTGTAPPSGCVPEKQTQRCTVQKKISCKGENKKNSRNRADKNGKNRGQDSKEGSRGGNKRRKNPQKEPTTAPALTTSMVT